MIKPHVLPWMGFVLVSVLLVFAFGTTSKTSVAAPLKPALPQESGDYVGTEVCIACHADQGKHFQNTAMGKAFARPKSEKEKLGCEACHGPGRSHAEAGGGKETIAIRFTKDSKNSV